jgi:hypothetical protein
MHNDNFTGRTAEWFRENALADFSKHRFSEQLRQEKPLNEQEDARFNGFEENWRIFMSASERRPEGIRTTHSLWNLSGGRRKAGFKVPVGYLVEGFNLSRGHTAEIVFVHAALVRYHVKKTWPRPVNFNPISRFMRPPPEA